MMMMMMMFQLLLLSSPSWNTRSFSVTYYWEVCDVLNLEFAIRNYGKPNFFFILPIPQFWNNSQVSNSHYDKCNIIRHYSIVKLECQIAMFFKTQYCKLLCRTILVHWWLCVPNVCFWHSWVFDTIIRTAGS
jgi:hypothetical protein